MRIFVLFCVFLGGLGQGVVNPKLPELLGSHVRLALDSGISASLMYLGIFVASFLYGRMADRGYTFRLMAGGLFLYSAVLELFCFATTKEAVFFLRFLEGLGLSAVYVSADVVLCRASADQERGRWLSYYGIALSLGLLFGPILVMGSEWISLKNALFTVLAALAACTAAAGIFALLLFSLPASGGENGAPIQNQRAALAAVFYGFLEAGLVAVLAAVVVKHFPVKAEVIFVVLILAAALASLVWGGLIDRIGGRKTLRLVFLAFAMSVGAVAVAQLMAPASSVWIIYAGAVSFGLAAGGIYPAGFAWLIEGSHPSQYGFASGLFTRAYGLGSLFGPLCFGLLVEAGGPLGLFGLAALLGILGLVCASKASKVRAAS